MAVGLDDPRMFDLNTSLGVGNQAQVDALSAVLGMGTKALAIGAGARGLAGLGNFFSRNLGGGPRTPLRQSYVRIPVPVKVRSRAERDAMLEAAEQDLDKEAGLAELAQRAKATGADWLGLLQRPNEPLGFFRKHLGGWNHPGIWQKPWAMPAAGAAILGGGYGGWKLTDYLLDKTKNIEQESELEEARKEYESALAGRRKIASAGVGPKPLDALADLCEKRGWWEEGMGLGMLGAGLVGLGSGVGAYNWTRSLAEDKAVEEAVKRRQAQIAEQAPSPVMAIPTPIPVYEPRKPWRQTLEQHLGPYAQHIRRHLGQEPEKKKKEKVANIGQAADQFLDRIRSNQMAVWQRLMTPADAKPAKPAKPVEPAPPQLPTLAGLSRTVNQPPRST